MANDKLIMDQAAVISYVFQSDEYTPESYITDNDILIAQERYVVPVIGSELRDVILDGSYTSLCEEILYPTLAEFVRHVVLRRHGEPTQIERGRELLHRLSEQLEANKESYPEYDPKENILKKCNIHGAFIQIR